MAKYGGTPPFFTQNFFFQNDSEWLEMDFKHNFIKCNICYIFFCLFEGVPKVCSNLIWCKKYSVKVLQLIKSQNSKVTQTSFELNTNGSQACFMSLFSVT